MKHLNIQPRATFWPVVQRCRSDIKLADEAAARQSVAIRRSAAGCHETVGSEACSPPETKNTESSYDCENHEYLRMLGQGAPGRLLPSSQEDLHGR